MKATGIVRRIDDLGRIVIPKEIRRTLRIRETDPLEIFTDKEGEIILKKYSPIKQCIEYFDAEFNTWLNSQKDNSKITISQYDKSSVDGEAEITKKEWIKNEIFNYKHWQFVPINKKTDWKMQSVY